MSFLQMTLFAGIALWPKVWTLDMTALPLKSPVDYRLTIKIVLIDGETSELKYDCFKTSTPDQIHTSVYATIFKQQGWKVSEDGLKIVLREARGKQIRRILLESDGPQPALMWEFAAPTKK